VGVEVGAALKNVVAIGAGMATGLDLGHNAVAALITRGLAEITRLATAMGAQPRTLAGLAGLGDLVLTCTGDLSRNRQLGIALSRSRSASQVLSGSTATTEGVRTAAVAVALGRRLNVEMPIAEEMYAVLEHGRSPAEAIRRLMERSLKEE
jgi:glycerol-3-phosphate dehydrogenase (NAD(P)+)